MTLLLPKLRPWQIALTSLLLLVDISLGTYAIHKSTLRKQKFSQQKPYGTRELHWREDLEFFAQQFPSVQVDFDKLYRPEEFRHEIADLEQDIPQLADSEIVLRLMRLVAEGKTAHNNVYPEGELEFHTYPVEFVWYSDGAVLTQASREYKSALGARIVRIGSMTPEELESSVEPYLSHENILWLHELSPDFILNREVAEHFGFAGKDGSVEFTFARPGAEQFHLRVTPISAKSPAHLISVTEALHLPTPLYRKHPDAWYWYEYLPDMQTLYIQYSRCRNDPKKSFKGFAKGLFRFVDGLHAPQRIERVIVDLRFNSGGDSSVIDPLIEGLQARPQLSDKGRLYVLISRGTFSSGMMAAVRLREDLDAILLGEGSGSPPNEYGEVKSFSLPNSKIEIQYTTKYFRLLEDSDPPTLEPDVTIQRSTTDFLQGRDQVLDTALQYHRPIVQPAASK
jgi:hypothetical protein